MYHDNSCRQLFQQYYMLNFIISWIQLICELYHFNYLNLNIMSYLFFKLWTYNSTYSTCLSNHNFTVIMYVINIILSLKSFKVMLYSSFHIFRYCFCTCLMSIISVDLHLLLIRVYVLIHFSLNHTSLIKLKDVWFL